MAAPAGSNLLTAIRMGVGTVQAAGYANPNAVLLNPADYATLDVSRDDEHEPDPDQPSGLLGAAAHRLHLRAGRDRLGRATSTPG